MKPQLCRHCRGSGLILIEFRTRRPSYWKDCPTCDGLGVTDFFWLRMTPDHGGASVDHIIGADTKLGPWTICGTLTTQRGPRPETPKRRCRKCVERIKGARPWKMGEDGLVAGGTA